MPPKKERPKPPAIDAPHFSVIGLKRIVRGKEKFLFGGILNQYGRLVRFCFETSLLTTQQRIQEYIQRGNFTNMISLDHSSPEDLKKIWELTSQTHQEKNDFSIFLESGLVDPEMKLAEKKPTEYRRSGTSAKD